jgi:hypothetical protein
LRIEAFSEARRPDVPDTNEDALLILPGRAYAVLDGVSDRVGSRYEGVLAGRYASGLLQRALERLVAPADATLDDPLAVVRAMTAEIHGVYERHGIADAVRTDWNRQMASTLALVTLSGDWAHVVLVGDSGVRIDGERVVRPEKDLDLITATLRGRAWIPIAARVADPVERERLSRAVTWAGTRHALAAVAPVLSQPELDVIEWEAIDICLIRLPHLDEPTIAGMVRNGIVHGQGGHQNNPASPLGYASLNGFDIPPALIHVERIARAGLRSLELFTDGYFAAGDGFGVDAWERRFAEVELADPHKVGRHPSVKGSAGGAWSDDRTYLGVRF